MFLFHILNLHISTLGPDWSELLEVSTVVVGMMLDSWVGLIWKGNRVNWKENRVNCSDFISWIKSSYNIKAICNFFTEITLFFFWLLFGLTVPLFLGQDSWRVNRKQGTGCPNHKIIQRFELAHQPTVKKIIKKGGGLSVYYSWKVYIYIYISQLEVDKPPHTDMDFTMTY